ncbi:hypothetical protein GQ55_2G353400 [Panicum hallii var. hallii]|uniref:At1g61320/AtMIF1 LRR domain-containing protein n=1 Tax=Panicum hallii var. hallii TaxID=1504633 RepID=A0A2T7EVS4_9POAL|nr:hypothetical protein GQ55_2G353400 [Panicum hallii var. hallii]
MPMRDAAQAACVSRAFLHSWKSHPNLDFNFSSKVDHILRKHSGIGVKKLKIHMFKFCNAKDSCYLDSWLQTALFLHPISELGCLRTLTRPHLSHVFIKEGELRSLLSSSLALDQFEIMYCGGIVCLKVPCMLQRLSQLMVFECSRLRVIDCEAPNISSFSFTGGHRVKLSLGETLQMKNLHMSFSGAVRYTRVELPSSMPNLETATIHSRSEIADTPMLHSKYVHLKNLSIALIAVTFPPTYDYFSLASLETFLLDVSCRYSYYPSDLRQMREQHHHKLKSVEILGFTSSKSLIELACHAAENVTCLERLTLEAHQSPLRCYLTDHNCSKCSTLPIDVLMEAQRALFAIRAYVEPKVPSAVKLDIVEPCRRCHASELTFLG